MVHKGNAKVHVGTASAGELLYCYNIVSPATSCRCTASGGTCTPTPSWPSRPGVPERNVVLAEDGVVVDLVDGEASVVGVVDCGYVHVDGSNIGGTDEALLKDRRILVRDRASSRASSSSTP